MILVTHYTLEKVAGTQSHWVITSLRRIPRRWPRASYTVVPAHDTRGLREVIWLTPSDRKREDKRMPAT